MSNNYNNCIGPVQSIYKILQLKEIFAKIQTWCKTVAHDTNIHILKITVGEASGGTVMRLMIIKWGRKVIWQQKLLIVIRGKLLKCLLKMWNKQIVFFFWCYVYIKSRKISSLFKILNKDMKLLKKVQTAQLAYNSLFFQF